MSSPSIHATRPLPGWLMAVCSGVAVTHLMLIGLFALAPSSGPWWVPPPFGGESPMDGPLFAKSITDQFTFPYYLKPLRMTNNYHFASNRQEPFVAYFEAHLKGKDDKVTVLKFPDEKANGWVRQRQQLLAQILAQDQRMPPLGSQGVSEHGKVRKIEIWKPDVPFKIKFENVPEPELNPTQSYEQPSAWTKIAAQAYAHYLLREHKAASVELVRCSRPTVNPMMTFMSVAPEIRPEQDKQLKDSFTETRAYFGEITRGSNRSSSEDAVTTGNAWTRFWFMPIAPVGMRCLRFLAGLLFFAWLASFLGHQAEIFSLNGWFDTQGLKDLQGLIRQAEQQRQPSPVPPIGWSVVYLAGDNAALFQAIYFGSLTVLALFTLGIATRIMAPLTWIIVVSFSANPATGYEGDYLLGILAFYLMIGHLLVGQWSGNLSPLERLLGSRDDFILASWLFPKRNEIRVSHGANLMMRLLQIHFAIIMVTSGLHKLQIAEWWGGVAALWFPLHPTFNTTLEGLRSEATNFTTMLTLLSFAGYCVLAWQLAFPAFAWRTGWSRGVLLGGAIGCVGMAFLYKLPLFGPFILLGSLSFLRPSEWSWALGRVRSLWSKASVAEIATEGKSVPAATK